jgi:carotenoid cleavage dioxygenase-like enzyme
MLLVLVLLYILITSKITSSFIKYKTEINKIIFKDVREHINLELPLREKNIIKKINGFYGLIGPNIDMDSNIDSLFELFTGDGIIQGMFFNKGNLTFVKHLIKTEKVLFEEKVGRIPNNFILTMFLIFLNKIKLFPNIMGMANTAILNIKNKNYALFERDYPYLINVDLEKKEVSTVKKVHIGAFQHFSGHSKTTSNGNIETIDYKIQNNLVNYYLLNNEFNVKYSVKIKFNYVPIIHDFCSNDDLLVVTDAPLVYKIQNIFTKKVPITLDCTKETFIHVYDKRKKSLKKYTYEKGFYILHYAYIKDKKETIEIYASHYNEFDFTNVNIKGNYRMIEINKVTKKVYLHTNAELEKYNLDFPILFEDKIISRNYENRRINGFVITKDLQFYKELFYENKHICGEPSVMYIEKTPYLIFFNIEFSEETKNYNNFLSLVNLKNYGVIDIKLGSNLNLGFHSIFLKNSLSN